MDTLTVRMYDVRFGDAILVSVPDKDDNDQPRTRHILIDVGNVQSGEGGENEVFKPVLDDVLTVLNGQPLDLYVMTHEHMDHVQGLLWAQNNVIENQSLRDRLDVRHAWLPASAEENYYDEHENARKQFDVAAENYTAIERFLAASDEPAAGAIEVLMRNNNRFLGRTGNGLALSHGRTADCVDYLRTLAGDNTHYVHRSIGSGDGLYDLSGKHNFREVEFEIWAPEEDSSDYYGRFQPVALGVSGPSGAARPDHATVNFPVPPAGVDAGAFFIILSNFAKRRIPFWTICLPSTRRPTTAVSCFA